MMIYPCVVKDSRGKVKRIHTKDELVLIHWGADNKCKGCGLLFKTRAKVGVKDGVRENPNHPGQFIPNLVPILEYCSARCRQESGYRENRKSKPVVIVVCDVCQEQFQQYRKGQARCSKKCWGVANRERIRKAYRVRIDLSKAQAILNKYGIDLKE